MASKLSLFTNDPFSKLSGSSPLWFVYVYKHVTFINLGHWFNSIASWFGNPVDPASHLTIISPLIYFSSFLAVWNRKSLNLIGRQSRELRWTGFSHRMSRVRTASKFPVLATFHAFCYIVKQRKMLIVNAESNNFANNVAFCARNIKRKRTPDLNWTALIKIQHKSSSQSNIAGEKKPHVFCRPGRTYWKRRPPPAII